MTLDKNLSDVTTSPVRRRSETPPPSPSSIKSSLSRQASEVVERQDATTPLSLSRSERSSISGNNSLMNKFERVKKKIKAVVRIKVRKPKHIPYPIMPYIDPYYAIAMSKPLIRALCIWMMFF